MNRRRIAAAVVLTSLVVLLFATPAFASPTGPRRPGPKRGTSTNWSGYAAETSLSSPQNGAVSDVKATWTVTTVTPSPMNSWSSTWVGIDGYSSGSVEQIGTEADWYNGTPVYYAWYEMYPKASVTIRSMSVRPGDVMTAEVSYTGGKKAAFVLTLKNARTGQTFTTTQRSNARRSSAEWVVEAPWSGGTLPLANFGTVAFSNASATINGHTGGVNDAAWQNDAITMVGASGHTLAVPSALSFGGASFTDTWYGSN